MKPVYKAPGPLLRIAGGGTALPHNRGLQTKPRLLLWIASTPERPIVEPRTIWNFRSISRRTSSGRAGESGPNERGSEAHAGPPPS